MSDNGTAQGDFFRALSKAVHAKRKLNALVAGEIEGSYPISFAEWQTARKEAERLLKVWKPSLNQRELWEELSAWEQAQGDPQ